MRQKWISVSCTLSFNILSDVHSCLFHAVSGINAQETPSAVSRYSDPSLHIKQHQNDIYCLNIVINGQKHKAYCNLLNGRCTTMLFIN